MRIEASEREQFEHTTKDGSALSGAIEAFFDVEHKGRAVKTFDRVDAPFIDLEPLEYGFRARLELIIEIPAVGCSIDVMECADELDSTPEALMSVVLDEAYRELGAYVQDAEASLAIDDLKRLAIDVIMQASAAMEGVF